MLGVLVAVVAVAGGVLTHDSYGELDRYSCRVRTRVVVFGVTIATRERDTEFSKMAKPFIDPDATPDWRIYGNSSLNPFGLFHNWRYGRPYHALNSFADACKLQGLLGRVVPEDRDRAIRDILACLANDRPSEVDEIVGEFANRTGGTP